MESRENISRLGCGDAALCHLRFKSTRLSSTADGFVRAKIAHMIRELDIEFLMSGDPVIRWQTMRDLLDRPESDWQAERAKVATQGWGAEFMAHLGPDGNWPNARWTANVWTMTLLVELGIPPNDARFEAAFERVVCRLMPKGKDVPTEVLKTDMDQCHLGFWLRIGSYFHPNDERLPLIANAILSMQFADGGWNCRIRTKPKTNHSSFHTTFNVLEGLREAAAARVIDQKTFQEAESQAIEFMLQHKMYRSDKTGDIVHERFLDLSYPSYWHYTVLRGLDNIRQSQFIRDSRLDDPLSLIESQRKSNGRWIVEKRIPGVTLFDMEKMGQDSRWNTLRALRVLKAAGRS